MILNVHGLCASTQVEFFYCALFHVLCFYPSRIVLCFLRRVSKILSPAQPACMSYNAACPPKRAHVVLFS